MTNGNIRGITITLDGDTTGLEQALADVNRESKDLQKELKEVERGLKLNPGNVELVRQQQELLTQSIQQTSQKLDTLRTAQSQVQQQFERGEIGVEQYRAFQRELVQTEGQLSRFQSQLNGLQSTQGRLAQNTRDLNTYFQATGTTVDDFSARLGTRLTNAIRDGSASADQLERALNQIGRASLGAGQDLDQFRNALRNADNGANLDRIRQDLNDLGNAAEQAEQDVNGLGDALKSAVGGAVAGVGIAGTIQQALDVSSLNTDIAISMNLDEEDTKAVRQSIMQVTAAIGDNEAAYEGVRRQMTLNKDASIEANQEIIMGAATISRAYKEIDFKELIQESHEIGKELGISQQAALGLVNGLLDIGFPPEQLDIISEYGSQLVMAGYNAEQVQAIMASGVATGTWNIDILLDGLKEGRIVAAEFGQGIDKAMQDAIKGTNISEQQLVKWGQAVASGGQDGVKAMQEMNQALSLIDDDTKRNEIGVKMYGTLWEEQGGKVSQTIQGMNEHIRTAAQNTEELNSDVAALESDSAYQLAVAVGSIKEALAPVLGIVADLVAKIGEWVSENATLFATITAIVATLGILTGAFAGLMPAVAGLISAWPVLVGAIGSVAAPITIAVGAIAGLGMAFTALWQNSETFRGNLTTVFEAIKSVTVSIFGAVASFIGEKITQIKGFWDTEGAQILQAANNIFNGIKAVIETVMPAIKFIIDAVWKAIKQVITGALDVIMGAVKVFSGLFTGDFSKMWEGIKGIFSGAINLIIGWISLTFFGGIKTLLTNLGKTGLSLMKGMWDNILGVFKSVGGSIKNLTSNTLSVVVNSFKNFVTSVKTQMTNVKQKVVTIWNEAVAFLKNINLEKIGKDIISGLIKGIGSMANSVIDKVKEIAQSIPDWAKDILGIHSPARVYAQVKIEEVFGSPKKPVTKPKLPTIKIAWGGLT